MVLLRASSKKLGVEARLESAVEGGDANLPHGDALTRFAESTTRASDDAGAARQGLRDALGVEGLVEASTIVGIFNGLVRVADASGIPLDEGTLGNSAEFRDVLGLNRYGGAANTDLDRAQGGATDDDPASNFR